MRVEEPDHSNRKTGPGDKYPMRVIRRMAELWNDERWMTTAEIAAHLNQEYKHDTECGPLELTRGKVAGLIDRARSQMNMPIFNMRGQANGRGSRAGALTTNIRKKAEKRAVGAVTNPLGGRIVRKGDKSFNQRHNNIGGVPMAPPPGAEERAMKEYNARKATAFLPTEGHAPVSYDALENHHCRWPVDGPDGKVMYCGRPKVVGERKPYCIAHVRK